MDVTDVLMPCCLDIAKGTLTTWPMRRRPAEFEVLRGDDLKKVSAWKPQVCLARNINFVFLNCELPALVRLNWTLKQHQLHHRLVFSSTCPTTAGDHHYNCSSSEYLPVGDRPSSPRVLLALSHTTTSIRIPPSTSPFTSYVVRLVA